MTGPERRRRVEELCDAALDRDARERAAFVVAACGADEALRHEVEALLAHAQTAEGFLATPMGQVAAHVLGDARGGSLVGRQVGSYTILSLLGAGGMGDVYRARDTKLGRDVAIKVVADAFLSDPERLARFEREARVLATLNHPHIGAIYGWEEAVLLPGSEQTAVRALVLELVEGSTLAERIRRPDHLRQGYGGPPKLHAKAEGLPVPGAGSGRPSGLPIDEALSIARQIADALEAAHEKGIIHRDLKPANIKVTPDGTVKVLDFGLAKAAAGNAPGSDLSQSSSISIGGTREGVILGTAAYMSPEQARGQPIDTRTDIWAFGCVLYEMLTGCVAFAGGTTSDTIARVLERDPDWTALPGMTPLAVKRLLQRCLDKDPKRRLHDIADARIEIEDALSGTSLTATETVDPQRRPVYPPRSIAAIVSLVALVAVGVLTWSLRPAPQSQTAAPRVSRFTMATSAPTALTIGGLDRDLAITPDGSRIIYRGTNQLLVRALDQLEPDVLSGLGAPRGVFVSPDGQWVGFFDGNPLLKKVAMTGGPPLTITRTDGSAPRGATWGPDGTIVYATNARATGLLRVSAAGGDPTVLTKPNRERGEGDHLWPEFLPGGRAALFTITAATGGLDNAQIAVLELETGTYKVLVRGGSHAHYVPTGHLVYGAGSALRAVPFDLNRLEAVGTPVPVLEQLATTAQGAVDAVIAANGTMAYVPGGTQDTVVWVDRQLREEPTRIPPGAYLYPRLSPDGQKVALSAERANDVWVYDFLRATFTRLTFEGNNARSVWTPDGARIAFSSSRAGATRNIYWLPVDGSAAAERLTTSPFDQIPEWWAPDGKTLMFNEFRPDSSWDIWTLSVTDRKPQLFLRTPFHDGGRAFSPDGRWLAYYSDESGRGEVHVRPFPGPGPKWQISTEGGAEPVWAPSGRELFYRSGNRWMVADVQLVPAFSASAPRLLFEGTYKTSFEANFDVSPDGRRFIMIKPATADAASSLVVVQNWHEELKRLVATR